MHAPSILLQMEADEYYRRGIPHKAVKLYEQAAQLLEKEGKHEGAKCLRERIKAIEAE